MERWRECGAVLCGVQAAAVEVGSTGQAIGQAGSTDQWVRCHSSHVTCPRSPVRLTELAAVWRGSQAEARLGVTFAGLFPTHNLMNHSCQPNTCANPSRIGP